MVTSFFMFAEAIERQSLNCKYLRSLITSPIIKNCYGLLLCNICSNPKNSKICVFAFFDLRKWVKKGELFQKAGEKAEVQ